MASVGVIGAGIAGLSAAYHLQQEGHEVRVLEAAGRTGGLIQSERCDGYLVEHGPNLLRPTPAVLPETIHSLGLADELVPTNGSATTRYVVRDGTPTPFPTSAWSLVTSDLLSLTAKLRLLAEPFVGTPSSADESVASFVQRRLGPEVLQYAMNPVVGGTFAGDPEVLSMRHAFGKLYRMERNHGSLLRGVLFASRSSSKNGSSRNGAHDSEDFSGPFSFRNGLETLSQALSETLHPHITRNAPVTSVRPNGESWHVTSATDTGDTTYVFDAVVCAIPLHRIADLGLETPVDCSPLTEVTYPPVGVVSLGYRRDDVAHPLDGFGVLVPETEDEFQILGTIFSSTLFPNRAPEGHVLLTTFVGGARNVTLGRKPLEDVLPIVERDLDALLGLHGSPTFVRHVQQTRSIPQYTLAHDQVQATLQALETEHSGLFFAGNYRDGISVGKAMASGATAAQRVGS